MPSFDEAVSAVKRMNGEKENRIKWQIGYMGDGAGNVYTARANWYLVRYPFEQSPAVPVKCKLNIAPIDGLRVVVGYLPWEPGEFQVITTNDMRLDVMDSTTGGDTETPVGPGTGTGYNPNVGIHWVNHQYLGIDPAYINWRQITPLGVFPSNPASMIVRILGGYLPRPGADVFVNNQTIDMTTHIPVSGARYSLISFDSSGNVVVTDGAINGGGFSALTAADIPDTPAGNWRSAAVALYVGQTAVVESRSEIDFYDLRFPEESSALAIVIDPDQINLTDGHVIVGDAGNLGADVALSGDATIVNTGALTVTGLQGNDVSNAAPTDGQALVWNNGANQWEPTTILHAEIAVSGLVPADPVLTPDGTDFVYGFV